MSTTTITKTLFFSAAPSVVWQYLTEKQKLGQWFNEPEADLTEGQEYQCMQDGMPLIWGKVLSMKAPNELVQTFNIKQFEAGESTVTWILREAAGGTQLTLVHKGIEEALAGEAMPLLMALDQGWDEHFASLRKGISS